MLELSRSVVANKLEQLCEARLELLRLREKLTQSTK